MIRLWRVTMLAAALALGGTAHAAAVRTAAVEAAALDVRIVVDFDGAFEPGALFAMDAPKRLVVDLPGARIGNLSVTGTGGVAKLRGAQFSRDKARIVVDLTEPMTLGNASADGGKLTLTLRVSGEKAFAAAVAKGRVKLPGSGTVAEAKPDDKAAPVQATSTPAGRPAEVQVAAKPADKLTPKAPEPQPVKAAEKPVARTEPKREQLAAAEPARAARPAASRGRRNLPLVVIDAGHGGHDVGAISVHEARREKDVTLAIARAIAREVEATGRARVLMTRRDDRFLPLGQRVAIARAAKASLFISVHADSAPAAEARGATIYTLSEVASDREAARLAAKENRSDMLLAGMTFAGSQDVADILFDLTQRETMNASAEFAATMQREMQPFVRFKSNAHRFAGFRVLKAPDMPSVLLETGYLSNLEDSKFLVSEAGQRAIANGVARAIDAHLNRRIASR